MEVSAQVLDRAAAGCRRQLGSPDLWPNSGGYSRSLALCIVDAVQATAGHYPTVVSVSERYCAYRAAQGVSDLNDGVRALLRTFEEAGSAQSWAGKVGSYKRRHHSPAQRVKARSIGRAADALYALRIDSIADFAAMQRHPETRGLLVRAWRSIISHGFAASWDYLLTLAGVIPTNSVWCLDNCAPFISEMFDVPRTSVDADETESVIVGVAQRMSVPPADLVLAMRRWSASQRVLLHPALATARVDQVEDPITVN